MKRLLLSLILAVTGIIASFGMSFSEAQQHAYFLTDKMAYELDLTPAQYDQVYQVNLEYLLNVNERNPYNYYWDYRNSDLSYILFDWQYSLYRRADYFYRPIVWRANAWHFHLWDRYHRTYYFFSRPTVWTSWRGGLWNGRVHSTPSPFIGHRPTAHNGGMRHDRRPGDHIGGQPGGKPHNNGGNWYNPGNNSRPNNGNNAHQGGNNRPNGGNNAYQGGNNRPNNGNNAHQGGNSRPNGGNNGSFNGNQGNRGNGGGSMSGSHSHTGGSRGTSAGTSAPSRSTAGGGQSNSGRGGGRGAGGHR